MTSCPRCGEPLASGQEYCLVCGARISDGRRGARSTSSGWLLRAAAAGAVAVIGAALAVVATGSDGGSATVTTAIGGFATAPDSTTGEAPVGPSGVAEWPTDEDGWTIALASLPQTAGRAVCADTRANCAEEGAATGRCARLVALREPPSRLLDRVLGRVLVGGRGDERARGRAQGVANGCRPSRRALIERCLRRHYGPRLCNTAEKALHSPCEAPPSLIFRPVDTEIGEIDEVPWTTTQPSFAPVCINTRERSTVRSRISSTRTHRARSNSVTVAPS